MSRKTWFIGAVLTFSAGPAFSQQWGTGMWGGMQGCPSQIRSAPGAVDTNDDIRELQEAVKEKERRRKEKQAQLKKVEKELDRAKDGVTKTIDRDFADQLFQHIDNRRGCEEYAELNNCKSDNCIKPYRRDEWNSICAVNRVGHVNAAVACGQSRGRTGERGRGGGGSCAEDLTKYSKKSAEQAKLLREIEKLEDDIASRKEDLKQAKRDLRESQRERSSGMEGEFCVECMMSQGRTPAQPRTTDWAGVAANLFAGGVSTYMGYQNNKLVSQNNASLGFPTQTYPALGYGMPYFAAGLYGAMGGGTGQGSFGCGQGMGGNVFGGMNQGMSGMNQGMMYGSMGTLMNPMMSGYGSGYNTGYGSSYGYGSPPGTAGTASIGNAAFGTVVPGR